MDNLKNDPLNGLRSASDPRDPRAPSLLRALDTNRSDGPRDGVMLLGLPYDGGIPSRPGARLGPGALRTALASFGTHADGADLAPITDLGDLALPTMNGADAHARIEEAAEKSFRTGGFPLFIGGDHGCTGSIIRGLARARPDLRLALVNIDAHLDVREYESEAHLSSGTPFRRALETPILTGSRTTMIGLRRFANSRYYLDWAHEQGIKLHTMEDIETNGVGSVVRRALESLLPDADAVYLSVDMDVVDAAFAPGVSAAGIGGLTARELIQIVRIIARDTRLIGADIMELSPPFDQDARTAKLAARVALEIGAAVTSSR